MARSSEQQPTNTRTVVLLTQTARKKLARLASKEGVSSGEIIRRSLRSYESPEARIRRDEEEKLIEAALKMISESLKTANASINNTCDRLDQLHHQLHPEPSGENAA